MLAITNLSHVYADGTRALDRVTLSIPVGMLGLLGPNGAGNSTLMKIVSTLQLPTCGNVASEGTDVLKEPGALRRTLGYLPQKRLCDVPRQRKKVGMLFAHLKRLLNPDRLRLRGPNGVKDEFLLAGTAQNLRKWPS